MSTESKECCPPPAAPEEVSGAEVFDADQLAAYAKALGHPARVAIMRLLMEKNACICGEIVDELPLAQSTVSQHLKQLKAAGLIRGEVDGPRVCYCVEPAAVARFRALVDLFVSPGSPSNEEAQ
ncbi:winged helix-turn-helix transcriptional regulator [Persicimonas caeni]|uniref:Winged helix-turn-helix transcriptional regulator n=1 Tax=Persicimonas caeni TaxID=2292766 RepID=A0A4Y6PVD3_PERCE|nr:metalloregulator ArsR/SmtB family transcription factor [Persicimonas caeni]QDG52200.1 winged helix-turn-helix transcriptional regulator [Persicimonas caeni]QED33422.1 winged helix-turn-helix transcriptional regulator [Persicimonas caeni]